MYWNIIGDNDFCLHVLTYQRFTIVFTGAATLGETMVSKKELLLGFLIHEAIKIFTNHLPETQYNVAQNFFSNLSQTKRLRSNSSH